MSTCRWTWLAATLLLSLLPTCAVGHSTLAIHHNNVQQGNCTLIVGPYRTSSFIDAGEPSNGAGEVIYVHTMGVLPVQGLCTHRDEDHLGGLSEVLGVYPVHQNVWDNGIDKVYCEAACMAAAAVRLKAMPERLQDRLVNWGYCSGGASVRCWYGLSLLKPARLPCSV